MPRRKLKEIEAIAFAIYLRIKDLRKKTEMAEEEKTRQRAKLTLIKGGKRD